MFSRLFFKCSYGWNLAFLTKFKSWITDAITKDSKNTEILPAFSHHLLLLKEQSKLVFWPYVYNLHFQFLKR